MKSLTLARHEALTIGDDITLTARHDGGQVRIEIDAPASTALERVLARDHDTTISMPDRIRWVRNLREKNDKSHKN